MMSSAPPQAMAPGQIAVPLLADTLAWGKGEGLLPAVIQHAVSGVVLMLGFMNREALERTVRERRVTFFSRARRSLWTKGATSGNYIDVDSVTTDCDRDALLVLGRPRGPVCHTGAPVRPRRLVAESDRSNAAALVTTATIMEETDEL